MPAAAPRLAAPAPLTVTPPRTEEERRVGFLPPYSVILHNDDHNSMQHVVLSIVKAVPRISEARAIEIMLEAHNNGRAVVTTCPLEQAELYQERLLSFGLTATIEPA